MKCEKRCPSGSARSRVSVRAYFMLIFTILPPQDSYLSVLSSTHVLYTVAKERNDRPCTSLQKKRAADIAVQVLLYECHHLFLTVGVNLTYSVNMFPASLIVLTG